MERLSRENRKDFMERAINLYESADAVLSKRGFLSSSVYEMELREVLMRKYRMISCIKLLSAYGMEENFSDMELISFFDAYNSINCMEDDYIDTFFEFIYNTCVDLNTDFLIRCLEKTDWELNIVETLEEYEGLSVNVIKRISGIISLHWELIKRSYEPENAECIDSEYLRSLGCEPDGYYVDMYTDGNLVLVNKNVKEMLDICNNNKEYREWDEYKELEKIKCFRLFDRYYPDISLTDLEHNNWNCISYLMGRIAESEEEVSMVWLNYESVIFLVLADMVAKDFLERYHKVEVAAA